MCINISICCVLLLLLLAAIAAIATAVFCCAYSYKQHTQLNTYKCMCNNKKNNVYTSKCVDLAVYVDRYKKNTSKYKKGHLCYAVLYNVTNERRKKNNN